MNCVISVVKSSYIASTAYTNKTQDKKPIVQWKMKPPAKKPLLNISKIRTEQNNSNTSLVRKDSIKKSVEPLKALSEFQIFV
jgi:hypothetical protein